MKINAKANLILAATVMVLASCGGSGSNSGGGSSAPQNMSSYDGNDYYAGVTGKPDSFVLPGLPENSENQIAWNSIALIFNTGSGSWTVAMNEANYYPNTSQQIAMGPFSGVWTTTPSHQYQYRVTATDTRTGLTGNANPINSAVPYAIFQPESALGWTTMPDNANVNLCSVSTNSIYTSERSGGDISCAIEVMDVDTSTVTASRIHLNIMR